MILLIGATSFLGPPVLEGLLKKDYEVSCFLRPGSNSGNLVKVASSVGKNITLTSGDVEDQESARDLFKDQEAAVYMVDLVNTSILQDFLKTVKGTGLKRIIFISSTTVHIPLDSPVKENKLMSEKHIMQSGLDYTILRPSMIYGVPDDPNFSRMLKFIKKRGFFITFGSGENLIQPVYIEDIADSVAKVIKKDITVRKAYDLPGKSPLKYNEMLEIVKEGIGRNFNIIRLPVGPSRTLVKIYANLSKKPSLTPGQIDRMGVDKSYDYSEAKKDFGYSPTSFRNGIKKLIEKLDT